MLKMTMNSTNDREISSHSDTFKGVYNPWDLDVLFLLSNYSVEALRWRLELSRQTFK